MQVIACQTDIIWEDKRANHDKVRRMLADIAIEPGALIVLPEMFATGFSMNVASIAEGESRETERFLAALAQEKQAYVVGGVVNQSPNGMGRNEAVVFSPDGVEAARYHKIHPFSYGREIEFYEGGDAVVTFDWRGVTVAPFVCYDLRFPEVFRHAVLRGAKVMLVIACWPTAREAHWVKLLQARAIENICYIVAVNRCGQDPKLEYPGRSMIIDLKGDILADAGHEETVISEKLTMPSVETYRNQFPALKDIRPGFLGS